MFRMSRLRWLHPMTSSAAGSSANATKGNFVYAIRDCTVTSISMHRVNTVAGRTYRFRIYEMNAAGTAIVEQVGAHYDVASPGTLTDTSVTATSETATVAIDLAYGKVYMVCVTDTSSNTAAIAIYFAVNLYGQWPSSKHLSVPDGFKGAATLAKVTPLTSDTWTVSNQAFALTIDTVDR